MVFCVSSEGASLPNTLGLLALILLFQSLLCDSVVHHLKIVSEVYLMSHLRGKKHREALVTGMADIVSIVSTKMHSALSLFLLLLVFPPRLLFCSYFPPLLHSSLPLRVSLTSSLCSALPFFPQSDPMSVIELAAEEVQAQTVSVEVEERLRSGKKRVRKLRQRMRTRSV